MPPLLRHGLRLEYATLAWNAVGTAVLIVSAVGAGSVALAGFGLDSLIEVFASLVVVWQLTGAHKDRERRALLLIGLSFFALAAYVLAQSAYALAVGNEPDPSNAGILWVAATVPVMLLLAAGKRRVGQALGNPVLKAEARVTLVDAYLTMAILVGLVANALLGWWWADPFAALVIVYYGVHEGLKIRSQTAMMSG